MKIVCDKCQTKYSIADEKVSGKVFKIRCKKCSNIIVVKGTELAAQAAATDGPEGSGREDASAPGAGDAAPASAGAAVAGDKVWYLVVAGEQVGPLSPVEVRARLAAGEVDAETYGWREGFADWLRLATIEEFGDAGAGPAATSDETRRTDMGDMFGGHDEAGDVFGGAGRAAPGPADDLFGNAASPLAAGSSPLGAPAMSLTPSLEPRPRASAAVAVAAAAVSSSTAPAAASASSSGDSRLTGQRNENSVLFSLSNLTAMANAGPAQAGPPNKGGEAKSPFANARNEGSGLIDIRAMAAATLSSTGGGGLGGMGHGHGHGHGSNSPVDIPSFSAAAPVFTPVVAAPVMMPAPQGGMPGWAWAVIAIGVLAIFGVGGTIVALLVTHRGAPPPVATAPAPEPPRAALPSGAAPTAAAVPADPTRAVDPARPVDPAARAPEHAAGHKAAARAPALGARHEKQAPAAGPAPRAADAPRPVAAAAPERRKASRGADSLDDLLNDAAPTRRTRAAAPAEPAPPADDPNLPETLDRGEVLAGMKAVTPKVLACYQQYKVPGVAMVNLVIQKSGAVSTATVGGALNGTPTGDCVARAVRTARFGRFKGTALSIQYPFQLR